MSTELCRVVTEDGLQLDGCYSGSTPSAKSPAVDAVILIHGTGSNFYAPGVLEEFATQALSAGHAVLRINTRGHDGLSSIPAPKGSVKGGAAYETLGECLSDIKAWIEHLEQRGHTRIGLVGHSSGAVKALYTVAHLELPSVVAVIGISPPRFNHEQLRRNAEFVEQFEQAEALVDASRGDTLQQMSQPLPLVIAASRIVTKYGTANEYDLVRFLPKVKVPMLLMFGAQTVETSVAFQGLPDAIRALQIAHVDVQIVEAANMHYTGHTDAPWNLASACLSNPRVT